MSQLLLKKCPVCPRVPGTARPLLFSHRVPLGPDCPPLELSSGSLARLAEGCGVARIGNTAVLSTVCRQSVNTILRDCYFLDLYNDDMLTSGVEGD